MKTKTIEIYEQIEVNAYYCINADHHKLFRKCKNNILAINASLLECNTILMQLIEKRKHSAKYEFGIWNPIEQKYDAIKRECKKVLKILKKFCY